MNLDEAEARKLVRACVASLPLDRIDAGVAPAFPCLRAALDAAAGSRLAVGAQDVHWEERGAFTGAVAPVQLRSMGVRFVIVGHSERRRLFGENDDAVRRKAAACRRHGLVPVVCVGETDEERVAGRAHEVVASQTAAALSGLDLADGADLVCAYEPVWAIGSGRTPALADIETAHTEIRAVLRERYGPIGAAVRILYGGSVKPGNAGEILHAGEVGGALVGGASLDAASFSGIAAAL